MQAGQWTTEIIIITVALAFALIGYLTAALRQGRRINQLGAQYEQAKQAEAQANARHSEGQEQLKAAEARTHELQVAEGKLQTQLQSTSDAQAQVMAQLQESKSIHLALQQKVDDARQEHHEAAKRLETAEAQARGLHEQVLDLRERLKAAEAATLALRSERDQLKNALATEETQARVAEASERDAREQLGQTRHKLDAQTQAYDALQERLQQLSAEHTELKTTLQKREEHFEEQMAQLTETRKSLSQEFENIANRIFEEKGKTFTQTSQSSIDGMLKPFRDQIEGFQKRINEVHDAALQGNTSLSSEIRKVLDIGLQMSKEANNLTSALKGDSQQRGAWGEAQLRRTLEMSGLMEDAHYEAQTSFKDADGKTKQTDFLIKIPDGKHIIIDSKVSLIAYDRAVSADSTEEYQLAMGEHVKAVRRHIDDLASKDYTNLIGMRSPNFVLMFMPIEPAYIEALKNNKDLFEYGYKKSIVLVSHTTLIPILRTVSNLWMIERSNAEARDISERAGDIYNQVSVVAERLAKLGGTLNTASNHYNNTVTALAGKQGLYGKVERFSQLSARVSKTLPQLEPGHIDFETERLAMVVEAIEEAPPAQEEALPEHELLREQPSAQ